MNESAAASPSGGELLVRCLIEQQVELAFCVPGESYLDALDALFEQSERLRLVVCRHEAAAANIDLVHRLEDPATWRIQGHFVALGHSTSSTILYTYDIYDASGTPVHRIVGQDVAGGADGDPWGAVDGDVQTRLAKRSARDIQAWLNRSRR